MHGIFIPLAMVYRTPYPWYFEPIHGILTPLPMLSRTAYPWYIDRYPCYFVPHTHGILNSLPILF